MPSEMSGKWAALFPLALFLIMSAGTARAGWYVDVCAGGQHVGNLPPRLYAHTRAEAESYGKGSDTPGCFTVEPGGIDDTGSSSTGATAGSDNVNSLAAQIIANPNSTAQDRVLALSAPLLQGFLQGMFASKGNQAAEQERQRQTDLLASQDRQRQDQEAEAKFIRIKGMLNNISGADNVHMTSISGADQLHVKSMFGDEGPGGGLAALDQLKCAVYFSRQAANAPNDEDAKSLADEAFEPDFHKFNASDLPPAVSSVEVADAQAKQYEKLLNDRDQAEKSLEKDKADAVKIETEMDYLKKAQTDIDQQIKTHNQAVAEIPQDDAAVLEKAKVETARLAALKAQAAEAVKKETAREKNAKQDEVQDLAAANKADVDMRRQVDAMNHAKGPGADPGWAQITLMNHSGQRLYLYVDGAQGCGPVLSGHFCTTHVRPGAHYVEALKQSEPKLLFSSTAKTVKRGESPTWTVE